MRKEIDWSFYVKIVVSAIFSIFVLFILIRGNKSFKPADDEGYDTQKSKTPAKKTEHRRPLRLQIIVLNTITIFFLLMSVQEYRVNEFMSPVGVDPAKIPHNCVKRQQAYYWFVLTSCFMLILYNFSAHFTTLKNATRGNIILKQEKSRTSPTRVIEDIKELKVSNGGFVVENYPFLVEYLFSVLLCLFSIVFYVIFVLSNYNVIDTVFFQPCFDPLELSRFYDPVEN